MTTPSLSTRDRLALAATAGQFFVNGAMTASFMARAPQFRDRIDVDVTQFGVLLTLAAVSGLVGSLLAGRVIHATSTRRVLRVGAVVMVASLVVIGAARSPAVWLIGMSTYMFVDVLVDISMNMQGSWISARRHTPVMNRLHGVWSLGTFAGGLGAVAANAADLTVAVHMAVVAGVMAVALVFVARNLLAVDEDAHADAPPPATTPAPTSAVARLAPVVLLVLAGMFAVVAEVTGGDWSTFRLTDDLGAAAAVGSAAFVTYTVGMTAMRFGGDSLQVRLGATGLHRVSLGLAGTGFAIASLVDHEVAAIAGFLLVGLGVATFMPTLYDHAARLPGRRGAGLGAMTAGMRVSFLLAPAGIGWLAGTALSVGQAIAVLTLPALIGLAVVTEANRRLLRRRHAVHAVPAPTRR
ncbi:MFS transporter [Euzebya sp.]|uniref:MFS transporter n=1 Tax=Euzebya sp. TaxID=1971409 RepID=UPI0035138BC5